MLVFLPCFQDTAEYVAYVAKDPVNQRGKPERLSGDISFLIYFMHIGSFATVPQRQPGQLKSKCHDYREKAEIYIFVVLV